jgi:hypothetical protein
MQVTAVLLNRLAQRSARSADSIRERHRAVRPSPRAARAGEYYLQFTITGPAGPIDQRLSFRITRLAIRPDDPVRWSADLPSDPPYILE